MSAPPPSGIRRTSGLGGRFGLRPRPLGLVFLATACLLMASGQILLQLGKAPESGPAPGVESTALRTARLRPVALRSHAIGTAVLTARRRVELFAETPGRVLEVGAERLDDVDADQVLVRIDPLLARLGLREGEASVARAESEVALARARLSRLRALAKREVASVSTLDEAENQLRVAEAALERGRTDLERARDRLGKTAIRAPFAGLLRRFDVEEGEVVREGESVAELLDVSRIRVTIGLGDREIVALSAGAAARVRAPAYPTDEFLGEVLRVGRASDRDTKKFPVQVEIPNPHGRLLPGMVARVEIELADTSPRLLIPREAVLSELGQFLVYVVEPSTSDGDAIARRRRVTVREIPFHPTELEVVSGLEPGEEVAVSDLHRLVDGSRVTRRRSPS